MTAGIRPARITDQNAVAEFTTDTFHWGDYVGEALPRWLEDDEGVVMVATDETDRAIAVGRGALLSPTEAWLQGTRVREDQRRRGIASALVEAIVGWGEARGALVSRLAIEDWNTAAQRQVESIGFRRVGRWNVADRASTAEDPIVAGNGGRRSRARRRLEVSHSAEAVPAWVSWRSGPLVGPARGMYSWYWRWSRLELAYLEQGARAGELFSSHTGWALARRDEERLAVGWLECPPEDGIDMIRSLVDLAAETEAERLQITMPDVDWVRSALTASRFELHPMVVYARSR